MACTNCQDNSLIGVYPYTSNCEDCNPNCATPVDSMCVVYTGASLACSGANTTNSLEQILQLMDSKICSVTGNYTEYNVSCLGPISTEKQFVEKISDYVCDLNSSFINFSTVTYVQGIQNLQTQLDTILGPRGISSCSTLGILSSDGLYTILNKFSSGICNIYSQLNPSAANWNQCFTLSGTAPQNIVEGFNAVITMICNVKSSASSGGSATLPTFNNIGTCLSAPLTATDTLEQTVIKVRDRLCLTPTFNANNIGTHNCTQFSGANTLEEVLTSTFSTIDEISQNSIRQASADFTIEPIDVTSPCLGQKISLNGTIVDRKVAINSSDISPDTLDNKIVGAGTVSIDFGGINAGKVTITGTAGAVNDEKVKATSSDTTAGYLDSKIVGQNTGIVTTSVSPLSASQLQVGATIDIAALVDAIFTLVESDSTVKARFCAIVNSCPVSCSAPLNASVTVI